MVAMGGASVIEVRDLSHRFGSVEALHEIALTAEGGVVGLLGPNGAGKTTLMRVLATLLKPMQGWVRVFGHDPYSNRGAYHIRRLLGYLPQDFRSYPGLSVQNYLRYMAWLKELSAAQTKEQIARLLAWTGLESHARRRTRALSGGMLRRLGIAQALLNDPQLLIVDEPTAGLDLEERLKFREFLLTLPQGCLTLLSTHLVEDVEAVCDRVLILNEGRLVYQGSKSELLSHYKERVFELPQDGPIPNEAGWIPITVHRANGENRARVCVPAGCPPPPAARPVEVTLQDTYLILLHEHRSVSVD